MYFFLSFPVSHPYCLTLILLGLYLSKNVLTFRLCVRFILLGIHAQKIASRVCFRKQALKLEFQNWIPTSPQMIMNPLMMVFEMTVAFGNCHAIITYLYAIISWDEARKRGKHWGIDSIFHQYETTKTITVQEDCCLWLVLETLQKNVLGSE